MRSIRKLYFKNAAGKRLGLNGESGIYATALSGFGFSLSHSFADLSRGFFPAVSDAKDHQNTLAFTIVLTQNAYAAHQTLVDWLSAAGTLSVVYNPDGKQEYCRDVTINFLQKGELNAVGWLELPCSFLCTTPWYLPLPTTMRISNASTDDGKYYEYTYDENLRYGPDSAAAMSTVIAGSGHIPGALQLTFRGAVVNPQVKLVGNVSGRTIGACSLEAAFAETDRLEFSTRYEDSYVRKISADGTVTDLLDDLDLSLNPFFHIPVDEPCTLSVEADANFTGQAELLIYYYFRSV